MLCGSGTFVLFGEKVKDGVKGFDGVNVDVMFEIGFEGEKIDDGEIVGGSKNCCDEVNSFVEEMVGCWFVGVNFDEGEKCEDDVKMSVGEMMKME